MSTEAWLWLTLGMLYLVWRPPPPHEDQVTSSIIVILSTSIAFGLLRFMRWLCRGGAGDS